MDPIYCIFLKDIFFRLQPNHNCLNNFFLGLWLYDHYIYDFMMAIFMAL